MNFVYSNEIIFGATQKRAEEKLYEINKEILESDDEFIIKRHKFYIKTNKRKVTAVFAGHSARGYRCSKAYVDVDVSIRILHEVVYPCMHLYYKGETLRDSVQYF